MEKRFLLKGLDCPNCAMKIEKEVSGIKGVSGASVNLVKQSLTVSFEDKNEKTLTKQIKQIVKAHEPDVEVAEYIQSGAEDESEGKGIIPRLIVGAVLFALGIGANRLFGAPLAVRLAFLVSAYIILGADVLLKALKNIVKGHVFDENLLMSISTVGAFAIGEYPEAVAVMLFYQVGEYFQALSVRRSRRSITSLMDIKSDTASVMRGGVLSSVSPETVAVGETVVVKPGERIPLDGVVINGEAMLDSKALTGESVPKSVKEGDTVLSGCINQSGVLSVKVTKPYGESTAAKVIQLVENAAASKAKTESFITSFARYYTPAVVILATLLCVVPSVILGGWAEWAHRAMVFLVISCPCALVISVPLAYFGGIGAASKHGVLVKGGNYLEALTKLKTVAFDKTGTLTKGVFKVKAITTANGFDKEQVLCLAAQAESLSNHPIAASILAAYGKEVQADISDYREIAGQGISALVNGNAVLVGNGRLLEENAVPYSPCNSAGTKVYLAVNGVFAGCILIADEVKEDSRQAIADLKHLGKYRIVMLTGDNEVIAQAVAKELGVDEYHASLLPNQKVERLEEIGCRGLAFVGDGINDAPVLARADVGIAMGALGSDAAIEAADVVLMTDEPSKLVEAVSVAKATKRIVIQNIVMSLAVKGAFLLLGAFGIAGMWQAVFADVGVALIAVLNSMRILKK